MSVRINTNASAINTHRHVVNNAKVQERNLEKLASGMKVNRGVDGAELCLGRIQNEALWQHTTSDFGGLPDEAAVPKSGYTQHEWRAATAERKGGIQLDQ